MMQSKTGHGSLSQRITLQITAMMVFTAILAAVISYQALEDTYLRLYNEKAQDIVRILASEIDGDRLEKYVTTGETDEYYDWLQNELDHAKRSFTGIQYLYLVWPDEDSFVYIVEGVKPDDDPDDISALGDRFDYGETEYAYFVPDVKNGAASTHLILGEDVGFGRTISAWAPVFDSAGNVAAMVEADCVLSDLNAVVRSYAMRIVGLLLLCMAGVMVALILLLRRNVTEPITMLTHLVETYQHEPLSPTKLRYNDETQWLADSFVEMTHRIEAYNKEVTRVTAEKERIGAELDMAASIQANALPNIFPAFPERKEFDVYATMAPAKEVGGDFYDFFMIDKDHLGIVVADVSGKGVPAALFMMISKTMLKTHAQTRLDPAQVLVEVNASLSEGNDEDMFVTVWLGVLDLSNGELTYADAGHEKLLLYQDGAWKFMPKDGGVALAMWEPEDLECMDEQYQFHNRTIRLNPGDVIFQYTDGVTEATDANNELFGDDRLLAAMNSAPSVTPEELLPYVRKKIDEFVKDAPQFDDITMLGLKFKGTAQ